MVGAVGRLPTMPRCRVGARASIRVGSGHAGSLPQHLQVHPSSSFCEQSLPQIHVSTCITMAPSL